MTNKLRIGIDVDGVLADFNVPYRDLLVDMIGLNVPDISPTYPDVWNYDRACGLTKDDERKVWEHIAASPEFWFDLPDYNDARPFLTFMTEMRVFNDSDIYFITSRPGRTAKEQTEAWLEWHGFEKPTVLISSHKGLCAAALNLTHYIDDRNENCLDVVDRSPLTQCYMLAQPWNQSLIAICRETMTEREIPRLATLTDFQNVLKEALE